MIKRPLKELGMQETMHQGQRFSSFTFTYEKIPRISPNNFENKQHMAKRRENKLNESRREKILPFSPHSTNCAFIYEFSLNMFPLQTLWSFQQCMTDLRRNQPNNSNISITAGIYLSSTCSVSPKNKTLSKILDQNCRLTVSWISL